MHSEISAKEAKVLEQYHDELLKNRKFQKDCARQTLLKCSSGEIYCLAEKYLQGKKK